MKFMADFDDNAKFARRRGSKNKSRRGGETVRGALTRGALIGTGIGAIHSIPNIAGGAQWGSKWGRTVGPSRGLSPKVGSIAGGIGGALGAARSVAPGVAGLAALGAGSAMVGRAIRNRRKRKRRLM